MGRFKMPPKPRLPFCWWCSRKLYGTISATLVIDGHERILHKACARDFEREFGAAVENEERLTKP